MASPEPALSSHAILRISRMGVCSARRECWICDDWSSTRCPQQCPRPKHRISPEKQGFSFLRSPGQIGQIEGPMNRMAQTRELIPVSEGGYCWTSATVRPCCLLKDSDS